MAEENQQKLVSIETMQSNVKTMRPATLLRKRLWQRCFPVDFPKYLRISIFYRTLLVAASGH